MRVDVSSHRPTTDTATAGAPPWHPIAILAPRLHANCDALAPRDPDLARRLRGFRADGHLLVRVVGDRLDVARRRSGGVAELIPDAVPPAQAQRVARAMLPTGACTDSVLVAGVGRGWLWQCLYTAPVSTPGMPGHRPPLYF